MQSSPLTLLYFIINIDDIAYLRRKELVFRDKVYDTATRRCNMRMPCLR